MFFIKNFDGKKFGEISPNTWSKFHENLVKIFFYCTKLKNETATLHLRDMLWQIALKA